MNYIRPVTVLAFFLLVVSQLGAQDVKLRRGIIGEAAPTWQIREWRHLPQGKTSLDIEDFQGKVLYLYCFQSWCPGCHKHGFPALVSASKYYASDPGVAFVAVQTTFEGESVNTLENAVKTAREFGLSIPLGQSGGAGQRSTLMKNYRTGGTPWTIIIDRKGIVRFNDFFIAPEDAIAQIEKLKRRSNEADGRRPVER